MPQPADQERTEAVRQAVPFAAALQIEALASEPPEVRLRLVWRPELCTSGGVLHGGALMALADTAGAACALWSLPPGAGTATIESKTNFLRPVRRGAVEAVSRPLHAGRTVIVVETDLLDEQGRRMARTTQTQAVLGRGDEAH